MINHTLLFMLLGEPEEHGGTRERILFPNDFLIFDEAHTVEQVASRQIGIRISQYGLRATIQRLYNARTRKGLFTVTRDAAGVLSRPSWSTKPTSFSPRSNRNAISKRAANFGYGKPILFRTNHWTPGRVADADSEVVKQPRRVPQGRTAGTWPANS